MQRVAAAVVGCLLAAALLLDASRSGDAASARVLYTVRPAAIGWVGPAGLAQRLVTPVSPRRSVEAARSVGERAKPDLDGAAATQPVTRSSTDTLAAQQGRHGAYY